MDIVEMPQYHLAYALLPYKRNQDVIKILPLKSKLNFVASVVDGWNELTLNTDKPGRSVARFVSEHFPKKFLDSFGKDIAKSVKTACLQLDTAIMKLFPTCSTCVATFLFSFNKQDIIISVGDVETYVWNGSLWYKPKEIGSHALDPKKYASNVSRFFGCPRRKSDPLYSAEPDVVTLPSGVPLIIVTDGIKGVLTLVEINNVMETVQKRTPKAIVGALMDEVQRRGTQRDDISIFVRWSV